MNDHVSGAAARMSEHAKVLRQGAAPHQQPLAEDLETLCSAVTGTPLVGETSVQTTLDELALANTTIEGMKDQLTKARAERDEASKMVEDLKAKLEERDAEVETLNQAVIELQEEAKKLGVHSTKGETHADLKEKAQASQTTKKGGHKH
jgi:chromosome segregation ATPase